MRNVTQLKGSKLASVFIRSLILSIFLTAKNVTIFNMVFNEESLMGSDIFVPSISQKLL